MNLREALEGKEYMILSIETQDKEMDKEEFLPFGGTIDWGGFTRCLLHVPLYRGRNHYQHLRKKRTSRCHY